MSGLAAPWSLQLPQGFGWERRGCRRLTSGRELSATQAVLVPTALPSFPLSVSPLLPPEPTGEGEGEGEGVAQP